MANLSVVTIVVLITSTYFPGMGSMIGATGQLAGFSAELLVAWAAYRVLQRSGGLNIAG
jgi:ABC-type amino acid transport substrate-binding protein